MAAPVTFSSGKGPMPKINIGSRIIFTNSPAVVARKAARLLPMAVKIPVNVWFKKEKITKPQVMTRYILASEITCGLFNLKKPMRGELKPAQISP